jgi:uncharacterized protein (DUF427 family)
MPRASWKGTTIAETDVFEEVEGNVYFPPQSVDQRWLQPSGRTSVCPWKGTARYYDVVVGDEANPAAAWYYPDPEPAVARIKDHIAFWKGVTVER